MQLLQLLFVPAALAVVLLASLPAASREPAAPSPEFPVSAEVIPEHDVKIEILKSFWFRL